MRMCDILIELEQKVELGEITKEEVECMTLEDIIDLVQLD